MACTSNRQRRFEVEAGWGASLKTSGSSPSPGPRVRAAEQADPLRGDSISQTRGLHGTIFSLNPCSRNFPFGLSSSTFRNPFRTGSPSELLLSINTARHHPDQVRLSMVCYGLFLKSDRVMEANSCFILKWPSKWVVWFHHFCGQHPVP